MIMKLTDGGYALKCDICLEEADICFTNPRDAISYREENGYETQYTYEVLYDVCPKCQE